MRALMVVMAMAVASGAAAQSIERENGEETAIAERLNWFYNSRGINQQQRPDVLRAAAIEVLKTETARAPGGPRWEPMGPAPMTMLTWVMGPVAGRVSALDIDPNDENVLYLGTASGGFWKSMDGGLSWTERFSQIGTQSIGSVHVEPANPQRVWVGTGEKGQSCTSYFGLGLFLSTDGGTTFSARNGAGASMLRLSWVTAVATQPGNANVILAGGYGFCGANGVAEPGALYRSTDAGGSWSKVADGAINDVVFDPNSPSTVYAAVSTIGLLKSTNGGASFTLTSADTSNAGRIRVALARSDTQTLYLLGSNSSLRRSVNGGSNWQLLSSAACEGQCSYNLTMDVDPANANEILVGTIRHSRGSATDTAIALTAQTATWGGAQTVHQDTHVVRYSKTRPNRYWVGTDGGLWRTDNGGGNFSNLNAGLNITQFYDIALDPYQPDRQFGGAQDNSSSARLNAAPLWNVTIVSGDGFMNLVNPANPRIVYQTSYPNGNGPNIARSTSGGAVNSFSFLSATGISGAGDSFPFFTPMAMSAAGVWGAPRMLVGGRRVWVADASASSIVWTAASADLGTQFGVIEAFANGDKAAAFVGGRDGRIFRCADLATATSCIASAAAAADMRYISDIAVDPRNPARAFATRLAFDTARLVRTTDAGSSWQSVGNGLPGVPANSVLIDPRDSSRLYVATDIGVYQSFDGGANFAPLMDGLPLGTVAMDLEIAKPRHQLVVGSYGRGAWRIDLSDVIYGDGVESL